MTQKLRQEFTQNGFVAIRGLIPAAEARDYALRLDSIAGPKKERWTLPDGVNRHEQFWPLLLHSDLLHAVREVLGPDIRYLPHNDLHVGFSSFGWHRDNVNRDFNKGSDWDESREPYRLVRVGIYLHRFQHSGFRLGLIKGSHRPDLYLSQEQRKRLDRRTSAAANVFGWVSGRDPLEDCAEWVATEPGDAIIFDPRILHTGSRFHGVKHSIFIAYGIESIHFANHCRYYLSLRKDLGYSQMPPALAQRLEAAGLLAQPPKDDRDIEAAWIPSPYYVRIAKFFK